MTDGFLTILGVLFIIFAVTFPVWQFVKTEKKDTLKKGLMPIATLAGFLGLVLAFHERITELTTPFGTLHTQALADVGDIAKLKTQAEQQTSTINLVADEVTKVKTLSETVSSQLTEAKKRLSSLDATTKAAQATLDNMRQEEDFLMTVAAALGDDRKSFDKLKTLAGDKANRFAETAAQVWASIFDAHSSLLSQSGFPAPWASGVDPSKFTIEQLSEIYSSALGWVKLSLLEYIFKREDIPRQARLDFMLKVMKSDQSLLAMEYAGRYFGQLSGQPNRKAMALDYFSAWWDEHRYEFDGK